MIVALPSMDNVTGWNIKIYHDDNGGANIWLEFLEIIDYIRIALIMHIDNSQKNGGNSQSNSVAQIQQSNPYKLSAVLYFPLNHSEILILFSFFLSLFFSSYLNLGFGHSSFPFFCFVLFASISEIENECIHVHCAWAWT